MYLPFDNLNKFVMERFVETIKVLDGQFYNLKPTSEGQGRRRRSFREASCVGGRADGCSGRDVFQVGEVSGGV